MSYQRSASAGITGGTVFAGTLMMIVGVFQAIVGIAAIAKGDFFVVGDNYAYNIDTSGWGWIHLAIGIGVFLVGLGILFGQTWAKVMGIALAAISAISNFFWLYYAPFWSLIVIALDVFVIWALARSMADDDSYDAVPSGAATGATPTSHRYAAPNNPSTSGNVPASAAYDTLARDAGAPSVPTGPARPGQDSVTGT